MNVASEKYNLIHPGDACSFQREITSEMVGIFAGLSGDCNPVHMDERYCREHGLGSRIVHGMLVLSLVSTLIGVHLPGEGAVWLSQSFDFLSPARIGDVLTVTGRVTGKDNGNSLGLGILTMKVVVKNQENAVITRGTVKASIK